MQKSSHGRAFFLSIVGLCMVFHGLFVLGQSSLEARSDFGWRRTTQGWEYADSLPIRTQESVESNGLLFPALSVTLATVHQAHQLALPLAAAGFMACFGPWLLMRWPTSDYSID